MDFSQLAQQIAPALSVYFPDYEGTRDLGRGTAFPTTNILGGLTAGDRFWRTDLGFACYYDGTRWLTVHEYACVLGFSDNASVSIAVTTTNVRLGLLRSDYTCLFTRGEMGISTGATNNGTNFFTYSFVDSSGGTMAAPTTAADAANAFVTKPITSFAQPGGSRLFVQLNMTTTGAPSAQTPRCPVLYYRLIVT